jgi:hypothetical protein
MISNSHHFIFIHVYKAAGSSIRAALSAYESKTFQLTLKIIDKARRTAGMDSTLALQKHSTAAEYLSVLKERYWDYFKFAFVRNPLDWQVSLYHYTQQTPEHHEHALIRSFTFDEYIEWRCHACPRHQIDLLTDSSGNVIVDFIGKVENIDHDFHSVAKLLGIKATLPHVNRSAHRDYRDYYTPASRAMVVDTFRRDFEMLDYPLPAGD